MTRKQSRVQVVLEFPIKCSPSILYNYISSASGLQEWFAHKVVTKSRLDYLFTFDDGQEVSAKLIRSVLNKSTRFHLANMLEDEYIEMDIIIDELTEDVALKVTEFCDEEEKREIVELWTAQVDVLKDVIGA